MNQGVRNLKGTANQEAIKVEAVNTLISQLNNDWNELDNIGRGERLNKIVGPGCSRRRIAKELGLPATTIRRYLKLAKLSDAERDAVRAGETERKALERKAARGRSRDQAERVAEEEKSGAQSDELAMIILDILRAADDLENELIWDEWILNLMNEARMYSRGTFGIRPTAVGLGHRIRLLDFYRMTRPQRSPHTIAVDFWARWIATILISLAPEELIREKAMSKAERMVWEQRASLNPQHGGLDGSFYIQEKRLRARRQPAKSPASKAVS